MATYITKKCPHCGYAYQIFQGGEQRTYGCPCKTCERCNKSYWDKDIKEPALHGYSNAYEVKQSIMRGITVLICTPIGLFALGGGIYTLLKGDMMGLVNIGMGGFIFWMLISYIKDKIYNAKHRSEIIAEQQRNYDASRERLKHTQYLTALAEHDSHAKRLLKERTSGQVEHYAQRPE